MSAQRTLFLVRHGNRQDYVNPEWSKSAAAPHDPDLSEDGLVEARKLALRLAREEKIDHLFASPLLRTLRTANFCAERLDKGIHVEEGLIEMLIPEYFPLLRKPDFAPAADRLGEFPHIDPAYRSRVSTIFPEVEHQTHRRLRTVLDHLFGEFHGSLCLVSHYAPINGMIWLLTGAYMDCHIDTASVTKLTYDGTTWKLELKADSSHKQEPLTA